MPFPALTAPSVGFHGKLPSRGDFVRAGLPRAFTDPWDAWLQVVIAGSLRILGADRWRGAWMVAPVWRFNLPGGICGPDRCAGVLLPSVDRAGRLFPLTLAMIPPPNDPPAVRAWLDHAEAAGRDALGAGAEPDALTMELAAFAPPDDGPAGETAPTAAGGEWWTEGSPMVAPARFTQPGLPDADRFAAMLIDPARMA